ncbi:type VI secretion system protein TssA [Caballeronia sp. INDeC2]|uniref:type VI secretion system protein TssA n=1 Tax=Caballeronia sp. INDeC2 TaxID=2921747 RepID=UPI00202969B4|nr:type VI secretion system protein TssA [Caballeronia sp. INDeC2]
MSTELTAHQDWNAWLAPLGDDAPCGPDLEYDAQFRELEEAVCGRPEAEYGDTLVAAVPPDWKAADAIGTALMARTRDLRVIVHLSRARLALEGFESIAGGLALSAALLEGEWDHTHPQVDRSDEDPTARINALASWVDPRGILADLADAPLADRGSTITLREWSYANGDAIAPQGRTVMSVAEIEAALAASAGQRHRTKAALDAALAHATSIEEIMSARVGAQRAPDFGALKNMLQKASSLLRAPVSEETAAQPQAVEANASPVAASSDVIGSRADVAVALERICAYYARHEPASPVPLLLDRARSLIDKSFVDLMKDLAPEGLAQLTQVIGASAVEPAAE